MIEKMPYYDLDALEKISQKLGFSFSRTSPDALEISLFDGVILIFENWRKEQDTFIGFKTTPWHAHGNLMLMFDKTSHIELNEIELLESIKKGDVVINERYINNLLDDRWLSHKNEKVNFEYIKSGEEIRIRRV